MHVRRKTGTRDRVLSWTLGVVLTAASAPTAWAAPLGTAFTYQGQLQFQDQPANGSFDFEFRLFDAEAGGSQVGSAVSLPGLVVQEGVFTALLDFGAGAFEGEARWLDVTVGGVPLAPRQPVRPSPAALHAAQAGAVADGGLPGTYTAPVTFSSAGNAMTGAFTGDGSGLSNLDASAITSGTLSTGVLPPQGSWALSGKLSIDPATLVIDPDANAVGIGTSFPQAPLHVVGGADASPAGGGALVVGSTGTLNLALDDNELMARDNAAAAPLLLNNDGGDVTVGGGAADARLGVGTNSPVANLHVRGPGPLGSVLVTPGEANSTSQLFLAEQTSTSFGMILRYDGTVNQFHMIAQQSSVETAPLVSINRNSAGFVGLGTTSPQAKLHVAGDARIDGGITIGETARTLMIPAAEFEPETNPAGLNLDFSAPPALTNENDATFSARAAAGAQLPQGAVVTSFSAWMLDDTLGGNLIVRLQRSAYGTIGNDLLAGVSSSGDTGLEPQIQEDTSIDFANIDNSAYVYNVVARWDAGDTSLIPAKSLRLFAVRIGYTVISPLP